MPDTLITDVAPAHILIIDDELPICSAVVGLLEDEGLRAAYELGGEEGIEYLENHPDVDIVLLDISLGIGMNGIDTLNEITERFKYVQVIMFTSHTALDMGVECMKKGAFDYLTKPLDLDAFMRLVPVALEQKKLARLNDLYLGIIVHDLKNPLQSIIGALEYMKATADKCFNDQQRRILASADNAVRDIRIMIDNVMGVTKYEKKTLNANKTDVVLSKLLDNALTPFLDQRTIGYRKIETDMPFSDGYSLTTDGELYTRVLTNLVSNARRFTAKEGVITVRIREHDNDTIRTEVTNTGSYIEPAMRERIFEKFSGIKLHSESASGQNFGLGLTFAKIAVDALGGTIGVESENDTPSTTFYFTIKKGK